MVSPSPYPFNRFDCFCLRYPPGWLILFNRHWQHYHEDPDGWNWIEYLLFLIPLGFYLALLLRWLRLGGRSPYPSVAVKMDSEYQQAFREEILTPILQHYFRAELIQTENLPIDRTPLIVILNHAGMCFPWDFLGLAWLLGKAGWITQPLAHPIFFNHPWMRWWLPPGWSELLGGIPADRTQFEKTIAGLKPGTALLYAPEGWRGLAKGWVHRYQLATFDPSFLTLSDRYHHPILPILCIGSETLHPWTWNIQWLARRTGLPMFPISPLILLFLLFPSMGVWANRTHLRYYVQPLLHSSQTKQLETTQPRRVLYQKAQGLRSELQATIDRLIQSA
ncbi:MAG: 1-acyl-sn-glycerol-3-phosphate acyltransferase [Leptolyngbyaceae cyanobacterium bins.59]|nr:1-acyl-sn-glycerol-3-phosphate acyltransferase [Leptolyngbyaceae cyanobacterium bins.59]